MEELNVATTDTTEKKPKGVKSAKKPTTAKRKTTPAKTSTSKKSTAPMPISEDQRRGMIAEKAYLKAEQRGFAGGDPLEDWLAAESEVDALLSHNPGQQATV